MNIEILESLESDNEINNEFALEDILNEESSQELLEEKTNESNENKEKLKEIQENIKQNIQNNEIENKIELGFSLILPEDFSKNKTSEIDLDELVGTIDNTEHLQYDKNLVDEILNEIEDRKSLQIIKKNSESIIKTVLEDPLDLIDFQERQMAKGNYEEKTLDSKFLLENSYFVPKKCPENITYSQYNEIEDYILTETYGIVKCFIAWQNRFLVLGTSQSCVLCFEISEKKPKVFMGQKENGYGGVSCLDISKRGEFLAVGHESGHIAVWDFKNMYLMKYIAGIHTSPVLALRLWHESKLNLISSDAIGNVYMLFLNKVLFSYTVDKQLLLQKSAGIVFSLKFLEKSLNSEWSFYRNYNLLAMTSMNLCVVVSIEPTIKILFKFERPYWAKVNVVPCVAWGKAIVGEGLGVVLAVVWGQAVELYNFENGEENERFKIAYKHFCNHFDIVYAEFISERIIAIVDSTKSLKLIDTQLFQNGNYQEKIVGFSSAIISTKDLLYELSSQNFVKDSQNRIRSYYSNTINLVGQTLYFIGHKKIFSTTFIDWIEALNSIVDCGEWLNCFYVALEIFNGKYMNFHGISFDEGKRQTEMRPFLNQLTKRYIEQLVHLPDYEKELWKNHILIVVNFLTSIESYKFLFTEIRGIFLNNKLREVFYQNLEAFILRNKVRAIPKDVFKEIVIYFQRQQKINIVHQLIINLDVNEIDSG